MPCYESLYRMVEWRWMSICRQKMPYIQWIQGFLRVWQIQVYRCKWKPSLWFCWLYLPWWLFWHIYNNGKYLQESLQLRVKWWWLSKFVSLLECRLEVDRYHHHPLLAIAPHRCKRESSSLCTSTLPVWTAATPPSEPSFQICSIDSMKSEAAVIISLPIVVSLASQQFFVIFTCFMS